MTDEALLERFRLRDDSAIALTDRVYGARCLALARSILKSREDAEECVNDAYLRLWERIPPEQPQSLWAYLSRIVRNLSLDRLRERGSLKRGGAAVTVALDELSKLCGPESAEDAVAARELGRAIDGWLRTLPELQAHVFLRRYYFFETREQIAERCGISAPQVSVQLSRARKKLRQFLSREGYL